MRTIGVEVADKITQMNNNDYMLMDASAVEYKLADGSTTSVQAVLENSIDKLTKEGVEGLLGLTKEEIEAMADLILDTEVRIDKTYSSSKIYSAIQDAIDSSKNFTLNEIGKMSGASYKVVASTTEMTDEKIIYLLENGTTYDMYIVETDGTVTKIGDTTIDLSSYLKVTDAESAYLKKTEATSTYVAQTSFNNHITDTVAHLTQLEKNKLLTTDNITSTINNSSDNTQIPSAKATYDLANTKANTNHTHNTSDITDLSIPSNVSELTNDSNYQTAEQVNSAITTEIAKVDTKINNLGELGTKTTSTIVKTSANLLYRGATQLGIEVADKFRLFKIIAFCEDGYNIALAKYKHDAYVSLKTISNSGTTITASNKVGTIAYSGALKCAYVEYIGVADESVDFGSWQDVPNTVIVSENTKVKLNSSCYYTVINGVCYVTLWGFTCTEVGQHVVNSSMPKTKLTMKGICTYGSSGYVGGCAFVFYDGNGNNKLYIEAKATNEPLYGSFSYPVAE